jgi:hypothetical protein
VVHGPNGMQSGHICPWLPGNCPLDSTTNCTDRSRQEVCLFEIIRKRSDCADRRAWEAKILDTLEHRPNKKNDYILLRSEQVIQNNSKFSTAMFNIGPFQLVGTALIVLVKAELTGVIRNVEATARKVGVFYSLYRHHHGLIRNSCRPVCAVCPGIKVQWAYG